MASAASGSSDGVGSAGISEHNARKSARQRQEHAWLAEIRTGDAHAFEALYRSYYRPLLRFVLPYLDSPSIAEEVIEDVFVHLWEHRSTVRIQHSVNTYLFAAARNRALNVARRARVERRWLAREAAVPASGGGILTATQGDDDRILDAERVRAAVRFAIDALPEARRRVLQLRWQQGMSYAEIAAVVGSSVVAVERQLSRTLKALRLALPEWLTDEDRPRG